MEVKGWGGGVRNLLYVYVEGHISRCDVCSYGWGMSQPCDFRAGQTASLLVAEAQTDAVIALSPVSL